jgi:uncharacterized LabA/DUF88 family protein
MVLKNEGINVDSPGLENFDYSKLFDTLLKGISVSSKIFYVARLREHKESLKKSQELILKQRVLKSNLEKENFTFLMNGNVRAQKVQVNGKTKIVFKEKGVDVKIAVDLVSHACDKLVNTAILCSSDFDLQPAVAELKKRGVEVIYLGFEINPNKGLTYTSDRTILIRNSEVIECYTKSE